MKKAQAGARVTVIRGGRLLDAARRRADPADILVEGDTIRAVGAPGMRARAGATEVDARGKLMHPGLVNAHTHGHGALAKGMGDRWTLELLLTAGPWLADHRTTEDKYLGTLVGAAEMALKGCTACYDLSFEFPTPSVFSWCFLFHHPPPAPPIKGGERCRDTVRDLILQYPGSIC